MSTDYPYTRIEALKMLIDGKKMQCANCQPHMYFYFNANRDNPFRCNLLDTSMSWDIARTKWRIYKEPKKMVEKWLWVVKDSAGEPLLTRWFYSEEQMVVEYDEAEIICRADWSRIEVSE